MLGDSKTVGFGSVFGRLFSPPNEFTETPTRIATSGWTTANMAAGIDAALGAATGTPDYILVNLGANDTVSLPAEATWKANTNYYVDALNVKYPGVPIYMMRCWKRGEAADCNTIAGWIDDIVAGNASVHLGPDERVFLENGDDGATYTSDGTHPNDAGYYLTGRKWLEAMGF
jgi:lysophospholipase L1-like esterase